MPVIEPGARVLVTGASGFIAVHTIKCFLDHGFDVTGTVRSKSKGDYLVDLFKGSKQKFDYVIVEDISAEGAFDEAVKGVDAVAHTASPFHFKANEPSELFVPAINGTVGILKSLQKNNPTIKRIVITASVACIINTDLPQPHEFTDDDWNPVSVPVCEKLGAKADGANKYRASKILAEQSFWKFFETEKPAFDGVAINPPTVLGPIIHQVDSPESINTSVGGFFTWMEGKHKQEELPAPAGTYVDVRDVALAHVRALMVPEAGGHRFICSPSAISGNDYCVVIKKLYPELPNVPTGDASKREEINSKCNYMNGTKLTRIMGIEYTPLEVTLEDTAKSLYERFGKDLQK